MRGAIAGLLLLGLVGPVRAQGTDFVGQWEAAAPNGGKITLQLRQEGRRLSGTLSGNGATFTVEAELGPDGGFYGTARSTAGSLFIGGERSGPQLGIALAELNAAGMPDLRNAQELRMSRVASTADAASAPGAGSGSGSGKGAPSGGARAPATSVPAPAAPTTSAGANAIAVTPADQQLAQLLTSSPWCHLQYSQQMGATTVERVVFSRDGRVVSRTQRESAVNNREGSYYGNSTDGSQGFWRVRSGNLMLSADGANFQPQALAVSRNSNGYPIITAGSKEYYQCN